MKLTSYLEVMCICEAIILVSGFVIAYKRSKVALFSVIAVTVLVSVFSFFNIRHEIIKQEREDQKKLLAQASFKADTTKEKHTIQNDYRTISYQTLIISLKKNIILNNTVDSLKYNTVYDSIKRDYDQKCKAELVALLNTWSHAKH